jgi:D-alanyl-D-alanine carboxypeptidase/D-alanyl-D-alanine-endopeptidase (penicillin-binding protein 4)
MTQSRVSVQALSLDTGAVIYSRFADQYCLPASNNKLLTASTVLLTVPFNSTFITPALAAITGGSFDELCLRGSFDPTMTDDTLDAWAQAVAKRTSLVSKLVLDIGTDASAAAGIDDTWEYGDIEDDDGAAPTPFGSCCRLVASALL